MWPGGVDTVRDTRLAGAPHAPRTYDRSQGCLTGRSAPGMAAAEAAGGGANVSQAAQDAVREVERLVELLLINREQVRTGGWAGRPSANRQIGAAASSHRGSAQSDY